MTRFGPQVQRNLGPRGRGGLSFSLSLCVGDLAPWSALCVDGDATGSFESRVCGRELEGPEFLWVLDPEKYEMDEQWMVKLPTVELVEALFSCFFLFGFNKLFSCFFDNPSLLLWRRTELLFSQHWSNDQSTKRLAVSICHHPSGKQGLFNKALLEDDGGQSSSLKKALFVLEGGWCLVGGVYTLRFSNDCECMMSCELRCEAVLAIQS